MWTTDQGTLFEIAEASSRVDTGLTREQIVDRIVSINPSAGGTFLERFSLDRLKGYLAHLTMAQEPRGSQSRWSRPGDTPAIVVCSAGV